MTPRSKRYPSLRTLCRAAALAALILLAATTLPAQTATDLPLWFDLSAGTPPNTKLNQDATFQLQNEEQVAVDPTNPDNLVAVWRDFRLGFRQVGWAYSHDGGDTWIEGGLVAETPYNRDSDPGITVGSDGIFYSVILSFDEFSEANGLFVPFSFDSGLSWFGPISGVDTPSGTFEDKEMITCDVTGGPTDGNLYVPWTRFGDSTGIFCISSTESFTFNPPVPVSDRGSVQWPTPTVGTDGQVMVAWQSFSRDAIMCDVSYDEGATWGTDRMVTPTTLGSGGINGGILVFAFPALASDVTGGPYDDRFYCAYSDIAADGSLDLFMTTSDDDGLTWTTPLRINDDPLGNGADQFHPWTTVNPDGVVSVAFYDRRLDPNNLRFDLFITHSFDGGQSWTPNQRVSDYSSSPLEAAKGISADPGYTPVDPGKPIVVASPQAGLIGEYIGLTTSRMRSTMVFTDTRNGNQDVYAANMPLRLFPPRLTGPADGLLTNNPVVNFTWANWSDYDSALTYVLEYSEDPLFQSGVTRLTGLTTTSHATSLADGYYYWRVRAFDPFGDSSDVTQRTIWIDATAPSTPSPIPPSPFTNDTIVDPTPEFAWSAVTARAAASPTAVTYSLQVAADPGFTLNLRAYSGLTAAGFILPDSDSLAFDQFWSWRVQATDSAGNQSGYSSTETFYLKFPFIVGDLNDDGVVDAVDLALLIDVVFFGGAVPVPPDERADIDCSGVADAVDLAILIDHVFFGAPPPVCP